MMAEDAKDIVIWWIIAKLKIKIGLYSRQLPGGSIAMQVSHQKQ